MRFSRRSLLSSGAVLVPVAGLGPTVAAANKGRVFPFGCNAVGDREFPGATFSPDGRTLFVNMQNGPGLTYAIWGPWSGDRDSQG